MKDNQSAAIVLNELNPGPLHQCPRCGRGFSSPQALRMHHMRMHTRKGRAGAKLGGKRAVETKTHMQEYKQAYNRAYRARIKARGTGKRFTPIVYPDPANIQPEAALKYCPNCGTHLENWKQT